MKLSDSDIPQLTELVFQLINNLNQLWNLFAAVSGLVVGWIFTTNQKWDRRHKACATALYSAFAAVNYWTLHNMYCWLRSILRDLRAAAGTLSDSGQVNTKAALVQAYIPGDWGIWPGDWGLGHFAYFVTVALVITSIWVFTRQRETLEGNGAGAPIANPQVIPQSDDADRKKI